MNNKQPIFTTNGGDETSDCVLNESDSSRQIQLPLEEAMEARAIIAESALIRIQCKDLVERLKAKEDRLNEITSQWVDKYSLKDRNIELDIERGVIWVR